MTRLVASGEEHTVEALDYDGDGVLDLALGTGVPGIQLHRGQGDGTFRRRGKIPGLGGLLGCVHSISVGDFNNDGLGDLVTTCFDCAAHAGVSVGDGRYRRILEESFSLGPKSSAVGDLNGDGNDDLALVSSTHVSSSSSFLRVYLGRGNGTFQPLRRFSRTGERPVFLIAEDLDRDGRVDVVSADEDSSSLTISFGIADGAPRRFLRGDADNDGKVALNDAVTVLNHLFRGAGPLGCPDAGDSDDDGKVSLTDAVEVLSYLFRGARSPAAPGPENCGEDPTEDELEDCSARC